MVEKSASEGNPPPAPAAARGRATHRPVRTAGDAEHLLRLLIEQVSEYAIFLLDVDGYVATWNAGAQRIKGYTAAEIVGQHFSCFYTPEDVAAGRPQLLLQQAHDVGMVKDEGWRLRKDGSRFWAEVALTAIRDEAGELCGFAKVTRDLTDRRQVQEARARSQKLEALGTLSAGIAHDFNNILLTMTGNAKLALADLAADQPARESVEEIAKACKRATDLVQRIMAFSLSQEPKVGVAQLATVVEEALKLVRASLPALIAIRTQFAPALPEVAADASQIHQIIVNLATNAAQAIGARSGFIEFGLDLVNIGSGNAAIIHSLSAGPYVRLSVGDDGCGMDGATMERIFDPFFSTKGPGQGTGLGLSVVHGIMKSYKGAVTVYSQPGKGTTFRLYFPVHAGAQPAAAPAAAADAPQITPARGERVLFIDDEDALVFLVTRLLKQLGYAVAAYSDPNDALQAFRAAPHDFDVAVTDLSMPAMSGFAFARALLAVRPDIPILMTSGYVRPEDRRMAEQIGIREVILKPDTVEELSGALDRVLRGRGSLDHSSGGGSMRD